MDRLFDAHLRAKWIAGVLFFAAYAVLQKLAGGSFAGLAAFWAMALGWIWLPGYVWCRLLRLRLRVPQLWMPLTILLGTGFFAACCCVAGRFGHVWILRLAPSAVALCGLIYLTPRRLPHLLRRLSHSRAFCNLFVLWGFVCFLYGCYISVMNTRPEIAGSIVLNQDLLWNIGNAESFRLGFPPQDIRFSEVRLAYHYLTELTAGALSWAGGLSAYSVFAFYYGPVAEAALLVCVYRFGQLFFRGAEKKSTALCWLLFFGGDASLWAAFSGVQGLFGNTLLAHLISNINAQATALIFISIFLSLLIVLARRGFAGTPAEYAALLAAAFLMTFAKGPEAAIVICALAVTMVIVLVFQRPPHWFAALAATAGSIAIFAAIYLLIFASGANTSVVWSNNSVSQSIFAPVFAGLVQGTLPWRAAVAGCGLLLVFLMQPAQTVLFFAGLGPDVRGLLRLPPERMIARGAAAGGVLAYFLLWHTSSSQLYFAFVAFFFMDVLAVDTLPQLKKRPLRRICGALLAVGAATAICLYAGVVWRAGQRLGANYGLCAPAAHIYAPATADDAAAMTWLTEHSAQDAQFATNRVNTAPDRTDGISNLYSALSGRQAYMEGYAYAYTNEGVSEAVVTHKRDTNTALFSADTAPQTAAELCRANGIEYLVYALDFPGSDTQLSEMELVYSGTSVRIYKVN